MRATYLHEHRYFKQSVWDNKTEINAENVVDMDGARRSIWRLILAGKLAFAALRCCTSICLNNTCSYLSSLFVLSCACVCVCACGSRMFLFLENDISANVIRLQCLSFMILALISCGFSSTCHRTFQTSFWLIDDFDVGKTKCLRGCTMHACEGFSQTARERRLESAQIVLSPLEVATARDLIQHYRRCEHV